MPKSGYSMSDREGGSRGYYAGGSVNGAYYHGEYGREMSEFSTTGSNQGTYYKNGGLKGVTPPQYAYGASIGSHSQSNNRHEAAGSLGSAQVPQLQYDKPMMASRPVFKDDEEEVERGQWGSKAEFILSCVGFSVGIGNVWRFPYLAYQNGGGAFLVPYFILLIFVGKPMYYMETAMGQFSRKSPIQLFECSPIAKGVGYAMCIVSTLVAIYYNVIMAYSIIYMGASFVGIYDELPWSYCGEWWGANENCTDTGNRTIFNNTQVGLKRCRPEHGITENCTYIESSTTQFWEKYVLNLTSEGLTSAGDLGGFKYDLPLALLLCWIIVFLCLMKGVQSSGKVVYFTATFPYIILLALLVNGCLLEGAGDGIYYLFVPEWEKLLHFTVWRKAAEQMFFSLGISWGGLIIFGSYNKFNNKIDIDASIVSSLDFLTSLIASCVIFSVLGHLSFKLGVDIEHVAEGGQGLAFVAYPQALSELPLPWLWSILFFFMLFLLGLDSEFAFMETGLTCLFDGYPKLRAHKVKITALCCIAGYLLGLPCVSFSGQYILDLMDTYGAGFSVLFIAIGELVAIMWIYGFKNVSKDIKLMLGHEPSWFWKICWGFVSPVFLTVIFIAAVSSWEEHKYAEVVQYPEWATAVGWALVAISAIQIPLWAIVMTIHYGCKGNISQVVKPTAKWGPGDPKVRRAILDEQSGIARNERQAYDNHAMRYEAYHT